MQLKWAFYNFWVSIWPPSDTLLSKHFLRDKLNLNRKIEFQKNINFRKLCFKTQMPRWVIKHLLQMWFENKSNYQLKYWICQKNNFIIITSTLSSLTYSKTSENYTVCQMRGHLDKTSRELLGEKVLILFNDHVLFKSSPS